MSHGISNVHCSFVLWFGLHIDASTSVHPPELIKKPTWPPYQFFLIKGKGYTCEIGRTSNWLWLSSCGAFSVYLELISWNHCGHGMY